VTLAALGQRTQRLLLGTAVTCPSYRYRPQLVAQAFASLGLLYPGRIILGVGQAKRSTRFLAVAAGETTRNAPHAWKNGDADSAALDGEWVSHQGRYYPVEQARLYDVPSPPVPIYVAATGPKSMALAGKIGDG